MTRVKCVWAYGDKNKSVFLVYINDNPAQLLKERQLVSARSGHMDTSSWEATIECALKDLKENWPEIYENT